MRPFFLLLALSACSPDPATAPADFPPSEVAQPLAPGDTPARTPETDSTWTTERIDLPGEASGVTVVAARVASHSETPPGYDRIVFEFEGGQPEAQVQMIPSTLVGCGSGEPYALEVVPILSVALVGARGYDEQGQPTIPHDRVTRGLPTLDETIPTCDFEGRLEWALVLNSPEAYRVTRLRNPDRLVVDVQHASGASSTSD